VLRRSTPEPATLKVDGLTVRHLRAATPTLQRADLGVEPGEIACLLGRSGCGKTTFLHAVSGLIPWLTEAWVEGAVTIAGESVVELDPGQRAHLVATCLDRPESQLFLATVGQEIEAARRRFGSGGLADDALDLFELGKLLDRRVTELSSGERQRVALTVALAAVPRPLLLDEPTAHLDAGAEDAAAELLGRAAARGASVVATEQAPWRLAGAVSTWRKVQDGRLEAADVPGEPELPPPEHTPGDRVVLHSRGLSVGRGGRTLATGVDLELREGEIVFLTGPNGSGKSTLAAVLAGVAAPLEGRVEAAGRVSLMFPEAELQLFASTVAAEVGNASLGHGERARVLRRHRLEHLAARAPWTLSRGEQQRLVHAALDLLRPDVMIVDEPTQGLDPEDLAVFLELVRRRSAKGRAYLVISHRPEIASVAHRRLELRSGRVVEVAG
jgi:energy-coupling factor transport system ATP-binding protein